MKRSDSEPDIDPDADIIIYADDNTPFTADADPEVLQTKLQHEATTVSNWFEKNDMVVSSEKTKLMIVSTAATEPLN